MVWNVSVCSISITVYCFILTYLRGIWFAVQYYKRRGKGGEANQKKEATCPCKLGDTKILESTKGLEANHLQQGADSLWEKDKDGREEKHLEQAYGDRSVFLNLYASSFQFQKYLLLPPHHAFLKVLEH